MQTDTSLDQNYFSNEPDIDKLILTHPNENINRPNHTPTDLKNHNLEKLAVPLGAS